MPTLPLKATELPEPGHPAMNVPCAMSEGLPVGMMLVGRHADEATILRAADVFERQVFRPDPPARPTA